MYLPADDEPELPAVFVTVMSTTPAVPVGTTAVMDELELTTYDDAAVAPKLTPETFVKFVPRIVMLLPPAAGPDEVDNPVTAGGRTGVVKIN